MILSQKHWRIAAALTVAVSMAVSISSCSTARYTASAVEKKEAKSVERPIDKRHKVQSPQRQAHIATDRGGLHPVTAGLLREADTWIGTPYAWGGNDRSGVDCSGLVVQVYLKSLEISLPRTSEKQMEYCRPIAKEELIPGDLVFFTVRGGDRVGHVGIYIGDGNMLHASSSKGVVITPISTPYFTANYYGSGRVERYVALLDKESKAKSAKIKEVSQPLVAHVNPKTKPAEPVQRPAVSKPAVKKEKPQVETTFSTPMPSQVFASKNRRAVPAVETPEATDDDSQFFD